MSHTLKISINKDAGKSGVVRRKRISMRERLLTALLGPQRQMMVILPGNTVEALSIVEVPGGVVQ